MNEAQDKQGNALAINRRCRERLWMFQDGRLKSDTYRIEKRTPALGLTGGGSRAHRSRGLLLEPLDYVDGKCSNEKSPGKGFPKECKRKMLLKDFFNHGTKRFLLL